MAEETEKAIEFEVHRFDVIAVSDEFLKLIKDLPELSTAAFVGIGGKRIEGPKQILVASSMEEVERNLPAIVAQLTDPLHQHIRVIHRSGSCRPCAESGKICEHLGRTIVTLNQRFNLDVSNTATM